MNYNRPLSPHLTVHKWILSQVMSILHRATAIAFSIGLLFISLWLLSITFGPTYYAIFKLIFFNFVGKSIIFIISVCFSFYFIDEIRKIFWFFGLGIDIVSIKISSYFVIISTLIISLLIFLFLL
tara:strand:+ start:255 stop:629 length:375 start_codon:yes stop_codon:yes gene_type:complete